MPSRVTAFYRQCDLHEKPTFKEQVKKTGLTVPGSEWCYNVESTAELSDADKEKLCFLFAETFEKTKFGTDSFLPSEGHVVEVGPRQQFTSAWSTNAVGVCQHLGLETITRIERSKRYAVQGSAEEKDAYEKIAPLVHDRMTECGYPGGIKQCDDGVQSSHRLVLLPEHRGGNFPPDTIRSISTLSPSWAIEFRGRKGSHVGYFNAQAKAEAECDQAWPCALPSALGNLMLHAKHKKATFEPAAKPEPWIRVEVMERGEEALKEFSDKNGLGFDTQDLTYYTKLFKEDLKRNPSSVECFDLAQGNSEHSRHWFFGGHLVIDGEQMPGSLFQLVKAPWKAKPNNSTVAFADNSSAMKGFNFNQLCPRNTEEATKQATQPSHYVPTPRQYDITFTCETHNFPCGIAPFPGAETGTGGRLRDGESTGRGSLVAVGTAAYCVGNLRIPGYEQTFKYPKNMAPPLQILIDSSNGASDYGNKFGEPLLCGFTRTYGHRDSTGNRTEWIKPIMMSGGLGMMDSAHVEKQKPEKGMVIVKLGGPAYKIGVGGGAASSMVAGDNAAELDFNAVQRGDAEMLQKVNRVIRACIELGDGNPILSIHDQGAGGTGNVLKEIAEPAGAVIEINKLGWQFVAFRIASAESDALIETRSTAFFRKALTPSPRSKFRPRFCLRFHGPLLRPRQESRLGLFTRFAPPVKTPSAIFAMRIQIGNLALCTIFVSGGYILDQFESRYWRSAASWSSLSRVHLCRIRHWLQPHQRSTRIAWQDFFVQAAAVSIAQREEISKKPRRRNQQAAYAFRALYVLQRELPTAACNSPEETLFRFGRVTGFRRKGRNSTILCGDPTMSVLEKWIAEYQENDVMLLDPNSLDLFTSICEREQAPFAVVGRITGDGQIVVLEEGSEVKPDGDYPVNLPLEAVLCDMPKKTFNDTREPGLTGTITVPEDVTFAAALDRVMRLVAVGSKRFLTNKVDRCVTGLVAQQQCVGPLHTPLANCAVISMGPLDKYGAVTSIGEAANKGLSGTPEDMARMARLATAEALTNMMWAKLEGDVTHIKASRNWMWANKLPGEGAKMWDTAKALSDVLIEIGMAIDGGKDSLSMAAKVPEQENETVKCPGEFVLSCYAPVSDTTLTITPDLKNSGNSSLYLVDLDKGTRNNEVPSLVGSSFAQVYKQVGAGAPDADITALKTTFAAVQECLEKRLLAAGHDRSDGGLALTALEMAFAGNRGLDVSVPKNEFGAITTLFSEGPGVVLEIADDKISDVMAVFSNLSAPTPVCIGKTNDKKLVTVKFGDDILIEKGVADLRDVWEATSFELEKLQCDPACVESERKELLTRNGPQYYLTYTPEPTPDAELKAEDRPKVAILREEGSNGDREMAWSFYLA
eukprot:gene329-373_t